MDRNSASAIGPLTGGISRGAGTAAITAAFRAASVDGAWRAASAAFLYGDVLSNRDGRFRVDGGGDVAGALANHKRGNDGVAACAAASCRGCMRRHIGGCIGAASGAH